MVDQELNALKELVRKHYADSSDPLYLATVGQKLANRAVLIENFGTLAGAVKHLGPNVLQLVIPEGQPGRTMVVTPEVRENIQARFGGGKSADSSAVTSFMALPIPIQIAFCLKTDHGEAVAVRTTPPIRYTKFPHTAMPPAGYVLVEAKFRFAGLKLAQASVTDLERLGMSVNRWAIEHKIDPERLAQPASSANAFERFLAVQDPQIASRIVFPADIVSILLRHS